MTRRAGDSPHRAQEVPGDVLFQPWHRWSAALAKPLARRRPLLPYSAMLGSHDQRIGRTGTSGKRHGATVCVLTLLLSAVFQSHHVTSASAPSFSDEFTGKAVDFSKWQSGYPWNDCTNRTNAERQCYTPEALGVGEGVLRIRSDRRSSSELPYSSGMINSSKSFAQKYGYFEIRAKLPRGKGLWPAFWLYPTKIDAEFEPEIDVMEHIGSEPNTVYLTQHYVKSSELREYGSVWSGPDFTDGFHTFSVSWMPKAIVWYVDGVERFRSQRHIPREKMFAFLNVAVGGTTPGDPDATTQFPTFMEIDYVRVWKDPRPPRDR